MSCEELVELVTAYLEDALPARERAAFEAHLRECAGCERYLDQFRVTLRVLGGLPAESLSPPARQALMDAFAGWKRTGTARRNATGPERH